MNKQKGILNKRMKILVFICLFIFWESSVCVLSHKEVLAKRQVDISELGKELYAKSALLMDGDSKRVLFEKNGYETLPMASITKIMTCLLALELSESETVVEFSSYAASRPKVHLGVKAGSRFYMKDMLYSLMLESHNDTAVAIAEAIAGDTLSFANLMNRRAKELGAKNTNFVTPNGLDDTKHYTTAYDMALIASEAIKNAKFLEIINTKSHSFQNTDGNQNFTVMNKNVFLSMMEGALGIKTGFTGNAGYCFVGAVKRNNKTFISVVLASGWPPHKTYKWKDTIKLMNYGIDNFEYRILFDGISDYKILPVENGKEKTVYTYIEGNISTLVSDNDRVEYRYEIPEHAIEAPIEKGEKIGSMQILINEQVYKELDICTKSSIEKIDFSFIFEKVKQVFLCWK